MWGCRLAAFSQTAVCRDIRISRRISSSSALTMATSSWARACSPVLFTSAGAGGGVSDVVSGGVIEGVRVTGAAMAGTGSASGCLASMRCMVP